MPFGSLLIVYILRDYSFRFHKMCNTEQRGITGSNERCQSREVDLNQSPTPPSRSAETLRSPEWISFLVGLDSLGKLREADPRFPRHSIYHHALGYPADYVSLSVVISIRRWVGKGFSAHHRGQPRDSVAQPDPIGWPPDGNRNKTGRAASVPHFSFNRKSLLLPFSGVCSRLYSREIHLEMSSG